MSTPRIGLFVFVLVHAIASTSHAQSHPPRDPRGEAPPNASSPNEVAQPDETPRDDDTSLEHATPDPTPTVPEPLQRDQDGPVVDVIEQSGVGGPTAFASAGVLEVGGSGALFANGQSVSLVASTFVGWFIYDGIELSYLQDLSGGVDENGVVRIGTLAVLDVSGHLRMNDRLLAFVGLGPGYLYNGSESGIALATRAGLDILIGRSGVFRPSLFFRLASTDLLDLGGQPTDVGIAYGLEFAYSALF